MASISTQQTTFPGSTLPAIYTIADASGGSSAVAANQLDVTMNGGSGDVYDVDSVASYDWTTGALILEAGNNGNTDFRVWGYAAGQPGFIYIVSGAGVGSFHNLSSGTTYDTQLTASTHDLAADPYIKLERDGAGIRAYKSSDRSTWVDVFGVAVGTYGTASYENFVTRYEWYSPAAGAGRGGYLRDVNDVAVGGGGGLVRQDAVRLGRRETPRPFAFAATFGALSPVAPRLVTATPGLGATLGGGRMPGRLD